MGDRLTIVFRLSGRVHVGFGYSASGKEAFIWDSTNGMRELDQVLTDAGLDLTGWTVKSATAVSDDGLTIAGDGVNPSGLTESWVAVVPAVVSVPSMNPTSLLLMAVLLGLTGCWRGHGLPA